MLNKVDEQLLEVQGVVNGLPSFGDVLCTCPSCPVACHVIQTPLNIIGPIAASLGIAVDSWSRITSDILAKSM